MSKRIWKWIMARVDEIIAEIEHWLNPRPPSGGDMPMGIVA